MALVVVAGNNSDRSAEAIGALLGRYRTVSLLTRGICEACPAARMRVTAVHPGQRVALGKGCVLVCLDEGAGPAEGQGVHLLLREGLAVPPGLEPAQVISLGRGSKNTVTVSSLQGERMMISLQRTVESLDGNPVEPCELPLDLPAGIELYEALAAAAALLLAGFPLP